MKKIKLLSVAAVIFAVGSAFAPKTMENLRHKPYLSVFVPTAPCTASIECANTGSKLCAYRETGCTSQVSKP